MGRINDSIIEIKHAKDDLRTASDNLARKFDITKRLYDEALDRARVVGLVRYDAKSKMYRCDDVALKVTSHGPNQSLGLFMKPTIMVATNADKKSDGIWYTLTDVVSSSLQRYFKVSHDTELKLKKIWDIVSDY